MNFYKNVIEHRGKLLVRGIHEGKEYQEKLDFSPTLYVTSPEDSKFTPKSNNFRLFSNAATPGPPIMRIHLVRNSTSARF